ncbi:MAG: thiamine pyrophosphate-dependent enzyme, partial [Clostridiales bacterium]
MENISTYGEIKCEWAPNEKVAMEAVCGASMAGGRAMASMKHVGMNVATDPIFTMGYAGVNGGMVIVSADDPGCHSSQNEQDNRWYAPHAKLGMMEPADSQECKDFTIAAFALSERFDVPILLRMTTRVCHSKSLVEFGQRAEQPVKPYVRDVGKFAMLPATARKRHVIREQSLLEMEQYANDCPFNKVEGNLDGEIGIITSGISYQYAREVFGDQAAYLKLGLTYPLPRKLIADFAGRFGKLYVIEENDPYLENEVRRLGFSCVGKDRIPICDELNADILRQVLLDIKAVPAFVAAAEATARPPVLCAGCPHRGFFYALHKHLDRVVPVGDIGCYALGVGAPFNGFDYSICMGAGFSSIIGLAQALQKQGDSRKALGMLGDSTFFHSGLTSLIDIVSARANVVACVLDNSITAMTGHQENPGTPRNLMGEPSPVIDLVALIKATGIGE